MKRALCLVALALAAACDCDESIQYAIQLTMVDSISGEPVVAEITAVASDGSFSDGVTYTAEQAEAFDAEMSFARERAGTYQVEVTADGYQPWVMTGVNVMADECHVETVQLMARLQPIPAG